MQWQNVWVVELSDGVDLGQEALGAQDSGQVRPEDLDGDAAVMLEIVGEIDSCHPTATDVPLDRVAPGKGGLQGGELLHHSWPEGVGCSMIQACNGSD